MLKLARQRLLGAGRSRLFRRASAQQGLLQIVRDYCGNSNAVCADCEFPGLVREWGGMDERGNAAGILPQKRALIQTRQELK